RCTRSTAVRRTSLDPALPSPHQACKFQTSTVSSLYLQQHSTYDDHSRPEERQTMLTRRTLLHCLLTGMGATLVGASPGRADDWRTTFPTLNFGVVSGENEADRIARYKSLVTYMENALRVAMKMHQATDYAGTIEALKARKLEFARFGPASY